MIKFIYNNYFLENHTILFIISSILILIMIITPFIIAKKNTKDYYFYLFVNGSNAIARAFLICSAIYL